MSFYNTIGAAGEELSAYRTTARKQEDRILFILMKNPVWWTPFAISEMYNRLYNEVPITSIRRALTCLTAAGELEMSEKANAPGPYGKPNHQWRIPKKEGQQKLFQL